MTDTTGTSTPVVPPTTGHMSPVVDPTKVVAGGNVTPPADTTPPEDTTTTATPPADEPPEEIEVEAEQEGKGWTYNPTGDKGLDMALTFIGKHGYGPENDALKAAMNGDFSLLRAELAEKDVKGAEAYLALAEQAYERRTKADQERRTKDREAVHAVVGGEEAWKEVQTWAAANASEAEKPVLQKMLNAGGQEAIIAASFLAQNYLKATGGSDTVGAGAPVSDVQGRAVATNDALSPSEYGRAVEKARNAHKGNVPFEESKTYADLRARRSRYRD